MKRKRERGIQDNSARWESIWEISGLPIATLQLDSTELHGNRFKSGKSLFFIYLFIFIFIQTIQKNNLENLMAARSSPKWSLTVQPSFLAIITKVEHQDKSKETLGFFLPLALISCANFRKVFYIFTVLFLKLVWFVQVSRKILVYFAERRVCVLLVMPDTRPYTASVCLTRKV